MKDITLDYLSRAEIWILITTLIYFLMNGAQVFETLVFVPKWVVSPPDNFNLLLDIRGASLKIFWIIFHSLHEITFVIAIIFCWKIEPVRNWLLILFAIHFGVRVWTLMYFAPNIIDFQNIANGVRNDTDLISRTTLWRTLNYLRVSIFILISFGIIPIWFKIQSLKINFPFSN